MQVGDSVNLRHEAGSIISAGVYIVSRINPDGSFHVGDNTAAKAAAASIAAGAVPILPGAVEILGFSAGSYFTGKTASGTSVVYVTPGEGL